MEYVIKREDALKCWTFANESRGSTYDYSKNPLANQDSKRIMNIYIGKLGEMGFKYFLKEQGITPDTTEMFEIYGRPEMGDETDFKMPNGKKIDVKSTRGWGISARQEQLNRQHYYVGVKVDINEYSPTDAPTIMVQGYSTPNGPWKKKTSQYGDVYMYLDFRHMEDINNIIDEWNTCEKVEKERKLL
jgi:hypothetical protein